MDDIKDNRKMFHLTCLHIRHSNIPYELNEILLALESIKIGSLLALCEINVSTDCPPIGPLQAALSLTEYEIAFIGIIKTGKKVVHLYQNPNMPLKFNIPQLSQV